MVDIDLVRCAPDALLDEARARFLSSYRKSPLDSWLMLPNSAACRTVTESIVKEGLPVITSRVCTISEFVVSEFDKHANGLLADSSCEEIAGQRVLMDDPSGFRLFKSRFHDVTSIVPELLAYVSTLDEYMVDPDSIMAGAEGGKAKELHDFVDKYERFLSGAGLVRQASLLRIAADMTQKGQGPKMDHLVIAGFYEAKPNERALITNLIKLASKATILHPFSDAPSVFMDDGSWTGAGEIHDIGSPGLAGLFDDDRVEAEKKIAIGEFEDPLEEARQVAQAIYRLLLTGTPASSICVLLPRRREMHQVIESALQEFRIPYNLAMTMDLSGSQAVTAVLDLLQAVGSDFEREAVVKLIKSPYLKFELESEGEKERLSGSDLDHLSREAGIIKGRENWRSHLISLALSIRAEASSAEISPNQSKWKMRKAERAERTAKLLESLFDALSALKGEMTVRERCIRLRRLLVESKLSDHLLCSERSITYRDGRAIQEMLASLESMERTEYFMGGGPQTLDEFIAQFRMVIRSGGYQGRPALEDTVMVSGLRASYLVSYDHVFMVGMNDGEIPFLGAGNAFISEQDIERFGLLNRRDMLRQERFYFLSALLCARRSVHLSRPLTVDGRPTVASCFLEDVRRKLGPGTWTSEEALGSRLIAQRVVGEMIGGKRPVETVEADLPLDAREIARRRGIEERDRASEYDTPFDAVLEDEKALEILRCRFSDDHIFSPSGLEKYARCPFSFYMEKVLHLKPLPEAVLDLDARERGSLFHAIACDFYARRRSMGGTRIGPDDLDSCYSLISKIAEERIAIYPFSGARWDAFRNFMLGKSGGRKGLLRAFVEKEAASESPLRPSLFELSFGREPPEVCDPMSSSSPIEIDLGGGDPSPLRLAGRVDRVDMDEQKRFFIIDYKTGRSLSLKDIVQGTALQLPLYIEAVRSLIPGSRPLGGAYYQVRSESEMGLDTVLAGKEDTDLVKRIVGSKKLVPSLGGVIGNAKRSARSCVQGIRSGIFHPALSKRYCSDYCEYWAVCRFDPSRVEEARDDSEL